MHLIAAGLWSPLAPTLAGTRDALAEGRRALRRQRQFIGTDFKPQVTAFDGDVGPERAPERMIRLATAALDDLVPVLPDLREGRLSIALALPEAAPRDGLAPQVLADVGQEIVRRATTQLALEPMGWTAHPDGGPALAKALDTHRDTLRDAPLLVIAVDTLACRTRLSARLDAGLLFSGTTPWGLVPGEVAVALLFGPEPQGGPAIAGIGIGHEAVGEFDIGDSDYGALSGACWGALPDDGRKVDRWLTDWNNSRYRAAEMSYARLRLGPALAPGTDPAHPALTFGDTGAAGAALALALHGIEPGRTLITAGAPGSNMRAALMVDMAGI